MQVKQEVFENFLLIVRVSCATLWTFLYVESSKDLTNGILISDINNCENSNMKIQMTSFVKWCSWYNLIRASLT